MADNNVAVNNQIVRYYLALHRFHNAEFWPQDAFSYYHIIQEQSTPSLGGIGPALPALGHALAGSIASGSAKALVYPLELCITRLQVQRQLRGKGEAESAAKDAEKEYTSLVDAARKIYDSEGGLRAFYAGCTSDVAKGIIDSFLFFLAYSFVRQRELKKAGDKHISITKELSIGVAAGCFAKFFTTPIQNIVTRQQTAALVAARDPTSSTTPGEADRLSIKDIALQIRSERGIAGFWAGYPASVILTLNPAITFAVDGLLRRLLPKSRRDNPSAQLTFLIAALSKAIATATTYPVMLAKSRAQTGSPKSSSSASSHEEDAGSEPELLEKSSTLNATPQRREAKHQILRLFSIFRAQHAIYLSLRKIYQEEGLSGLYSGLEGEVLKGFLQHGFTMMMKENVHVGVIQAYYLLLKATRRWPADLGEVRKGAGEAVAGAQERIIEAGEKVSEGVKGVVGGSEKDGVKRNF